MIFVKYYDEMNVEFFDQPVTTACHTCGIKKHDNAHFQWHLHRGKSWDQDLNVHYDYEIGSAIRYLELRCIRLQKSSHNQKCDSQ